MDNADIQLLQTLFSENNELRARNHVLQRELTVKSIQLETQDEELKELQAKKSKSQVRKSTTNPSSIPNASPISPIGAPSKDLEDAMYAIDRKNNEIRQLKTDMAQLQTDLELQETANDKLEQEMRELQKEYTAFQHNRSLGAQHDQDPISVVKEGNPAQDQDTSISGKQVSQLRDKVTELQAIITMQKTQTQNMATEATRWYSAQQTKIQGLEALLENVKQQYEEFIQVTKLENDAFKQEQVTQYSTLKSQFEAHQREQVDEKRCMMLEHDAMMFTLQGLFEEYKKTAEYLFATETGKLQDELMSLSVRYEHELLFTIQTKDKFYSDIMVSKDIKIMNLIEGSDMNLLLQKHESEIDLVRKEYTLEIARIKNQQESEQNQQITALQRQSASLEAKSEKLTQHIKLLDSRIKDLMSTIEAKNRSITDLEEIRVKSELNLNTMLDAERQKLAQAIQEKEYLRHKVIRLNMQKKGTGRTTLEFMVNKISTDTTDLASKYDQLTEQLNKTNEQNTKLRNQVKASEAWLHHLEVEVQKRTDEFSKLTACFGNFIKNKASKRTHRQIDPLLGSITPSGSAHRTETNTGRHSETRSTSGNIDGPSSAANLIVQPGLSKQLVKIRVPDIVTRTKANPVQEIRKEDYDIESAIQYLKQFQARSRAFAKKPANRTNPNEPPKEISTADLNLVVQDNDTSKKHDLILNPLIYDDYNKPDSKPNSDDIGQTNSPKYRVYNSSSGPTPDLNPRPFPFENHVINSDVPIYKPNQTTPTTQQQQQQVQSTNFSSTYMMQPFHGGKVKRSSRKSC